VCLYVFTASDLSISSSVSPEVVTWKMSRTAGGRSTGWRVLVFLWPPTVGIVCLVVHHQLVVHKVEAVRLRLIRVQDHLAHHFLGQCGELVDVLACVLAAGHAEAKLEIKALEQLVAEVVSLNHTKVVDGCVTHCKLHCGSNLPQLQEGWGELVSDKTSGVGVALLFASRWCWRFGDLKQDCPRFHVTDLKPSEVDHVDIFFWRTKVIRGDLL